ncbi:MAG: hypothetical protein ACRDXB_12385, partial [Actinomycetes bacterium]
IAVIPPGTDDDGVAAARARITRSHAVRYDLDPTEVVPHGWAAARELVRRYVDVGLTKFVLRPAVPLPRWGGFLDQFDGELRGLEAELTG